ncbi:MAG: hypothetical protein ACFFBD_26645 [Candidatus Hodarchaeota archaeon]
MKRDITVPLFLLMLVLHIAHVFEEIWGEFWMIDILSLKLFLVINWILYCIIIGLFYFMLEKRKWAYQLAIIYAGFMGLQGIAHVLATIISGNYFGGFAGGVTGLAVFITSIPLVYHLIKEIRSE